MHVACPHFCQELKFQILQPTDSSRLFCFAFLLCILLCSSCIYNLYTFSKISARFLFIFCVFLLRGFLSMLLPLHFSPPFFAPTFLLHFCPDFFLPLHFCCAFFCPCIFALHVCSAFLSPLHFCPAFFPICLCILVHMHL